jgi:hypothetical protein
MISGSLHTCLIPSAAAFDVYFSSTEDGLNPVTSVDENYEVYLIIKTVDQPDGTVLYLEYPTGLSMTNEDDFTAVGARHDMIASAKVINGSTGTLSDDNTLATREASEISLAGSQGASLWYKWIPPISGTAIFNTIGSNFDTILGALRATGPNPTFTNGGFSLIVGNDDYSGAQSQISFTVTAGENIYIGVGGYSSRKGTIKLNWSLT